MRELLRPFDIEGKVASGRVYAQWETAMLLDGDTLEALDVGDLRWTGSGESPP